MSHDLLVRWRLNDPGVENRARWTRTHIRLTPSAARAFCGREIPEFNYMEDNGSEVPSSNPECVACKRKADR